MDSLLEVLLEIFFQVLADVLFDSASRSKNRVIRWTALGVLLTLAAVVLGVFSLTGQSQHIIKSPTLRLVMLIGLPFFNGALMMMVGRSLERKGRSRSRFEYFWPGFLFSAIFGVIRFFGAH